MLDGVSSLGLLTADRFAVSTTLRDLGFDHRGLSPMEQRYLAALHKSTGPIPAGRLACVLGTSVKTLTALVEPYLFRLGLVRMTAQGRTVIRGPRRLATSVLDV